MSVFFIKIISQITSEDFTVDDDKVTRFTKLVLTLSYIWMEVDKIFAVSSYNRSWSILLSINLLQRLTKKENIICYPLPHLYTAFVHQFFSNQMTDYNSQISCYNKNMQRNLMIIRRSIHWLIHYSNKKFLLFFNVIK